MSKRVHPKMQNRLSEGVRSLNVLEVAALLGVSHYTVRDWVYQRKIPFFKAGWCLRFDRAEIEKWIKRTSYVPRLKDTFLNISRPRKAKSKTPRTETLPEPRAKLSRKGLQKRRVARLVPEGFRVLHRGRRRRPSRSA